MKSYTIRIELQSKIFSNFQVLHNQMKNMGFRKTIMSDAGIEYHLPRSVYVTTGFTAEEVLLEAQQAVDKTGSKAEILVLETSEYLWSGLIPVK